MKSAVCRQFCSSLNVLKAFLGPNDLIFSFPFLFSPSNIQSFCGYIQQLPSLEQKMAKKKIVTRSCPGGGENMYVDLCGE